MANIAEFPNYTVSKQGIIRNKRTGCTLTPVIRNGYVAIRLSKDNHLYNRSIHRLIYEAFKGPVPRGLHINHINGIRSDNRLDNLEVCTPAENNERRLFLVRGTEVNTNKLSEAQVMEIRRAKRDGANSMELAHTYGVSKSNINRIARGKLWKHLPVLEVDNSVWGNSKVTGAISGKVLREKYGQDYFARVAKAQRIKKHCLTCTCV